VTSLGESADQPAAAPQPAAPGPVVPDPDAALARLGLTLPVVPAPLAAYVPAVAAGTTVWTAGQLPFVDGVLTVTGIVGGDGPDAVDEASATAAARTAALNALSAVASVAGSLRNVARIAKITVFVASAPGWTGQPRVADGASRLIGEVFGDAGRHARSAVGVSGLPAGSPVEVEVVAVLTAPLPV